MLWSKHMRRRHDMPNAASHGQPSLKVDVMGTEQTCLLALGQGPLRASRLAQGMDLLHTFAYLFRKPVLNTGRTLFTQGDTTRGFLRHVTQLLRSVDLAPKSAVLAHLREVFPHLLYQEQELLTHILKEIARAILKLVLLFGKSNG